MAILKIKDKNGNFIGVPTITGMPKGIYIGVEEPTDLDTILWIDTSASTFTFTVKGTECTAEENMTWAEWLESDYNTDKENFWNGGSMVYAYAGLIQLQGSGVITTPEDIIVVNGTYTAMAFPD